MNTFNVINGCPISPIKPIRSFANCASGKYKRELEQYKKQQAEYSDYIFSHSMELDDIPFDIINTLKEYYNKTYGNQKGRINIDDLMEMGQFMAKHNLGRVKIWLGPEDQYFIHFKKSVRKYFPEYCPPRGWKQADSWYGDPMKSDN